MACDEGRFSKKGERSYAVNQEYASEAIIFTLQEIGQCCAASGGVGRLGWEAQESSTEKKELLPIANGTASKCFYAETHAKG